MGETRKCCKRFVEIRLASGASWTYHHMECAGKAERRRHFGSSCSGPPDTKEVSPFGCHRTPKYSALEGLAGTREMHSLASVTCEPWSLSRRGENTAPD